MEIILTGKPSKALIPYDERCAFWAEKVYAVTSAMVAAYARALKDKNINQDVLSGRLGRNKAQISRWLGGQKNITVRTLSEMALALECDLRFEFIPIDQIPAANFWYCLPEKPSYTSGMGELKVISVNNSSETANSTGSNISAQLTVEKHYLETQG
jgi:transcriptional regulator with XRE-family HTH domain